MSEAAVMATEKQAVPKGYKQTEVGVIPEDWSASRLGNFVRLLESGVSVNSIDKLDVYTHGMHILKTSCVSKGYFYPDQIKSIVPDETKRAKTPLASNTIVVSRMNTPALVGEVGYVSHCSSKIFLPDRLWQMSFYSEDKINVRWLAYILSFEPIAFKIKEAATGTSNSMKNISKESFLATLLPVPAVKEQTAIANALSDMDALLTELEQLIAKKQAIKTATMQQLLTGKTRLPQFAIHTDGEHKGQPKGMKPSELGEIPEDWEVCTIADVSLVPMQNGLFYEPSRKGKGIPLINVSDMYTSAPISVKSLELFDASSAEEKAFRVIEGDLFFTRSSIVPSGIAYCNIFDSKDVTPVFDSHLIRVRVDPDLVDFRFIYLNCLSRHARQHLISNAKTATMTTIDQKAIKSCPVILPSKQEQTAIANILSDMDAEIQALEQRLAKTRQIKQGMMQELLTGKTRLPFDVTSKGEE